MKNIELSDINYKLVDISTLPIDVIDMLKPYATNFVNIIDYPLSDTNGLILSPTLWWDMGDENLNRIPINLESILSVCIFAGPGCDVYKVIDKSKPSWLIYNTDNETILFKI